MLFSQSTIFSHDIHSCFKVWGQQDYFNAFERSPISLLYLFDQKLSKNSITTVLQ